ncbi:MAG: NAD(P)/FAD-dependent oxidoreductase [Candidatus Obscuribacterales bacterium]
MKNYDLIIVGAGGAGMMCAAEAAKRGKRVLLIDHASVLGRKILISGGGRCNFTNTGATAANYFSANPHFCKSALSRYTPDDFIALVKKHRIAFHEKKLGQLFCDGSAQSIVDMLQKECHNAGVDFQMRCTVDSISHVTQQQLFQLDTSHGAYHCERLVIATGGLSIPKIGATGFGYRIAEQFGLKIVKTAPALVGFNLGEPELQELPELSGVSFDSIVCASGVAFHENSLFTHTGLSGPAILQASLYWNPQEPLEIDTLPGKPLLEDLLERKRLGSRTELKNILADYLPKRFAEKFCQLYLKSRPLNQYNDKQILEIAATLHNWRVVPRSSVGYMKAEVTRGGVDTNELSSRSMESQKVPGLHFIGEVVDVTGQLGGYNFQWAWASAYAAAESM